MKKTENARRALVEAEEKLRNYFQHSLFDLEREKQLAREVTQARDKFIDQLETMCPRMPE
jgi:hypothetical protein